MAIAMRAAKSKGIPIVFDPVGADATSLRTETCKKLLGETNVSIIRGNESEIVALLDSSIQTKGVDSSETTDLAETSAKALAFSYNCVVCVSGETDLITDGAEVLLIKNGHSLMPKVTGLGCTATAIIGACAAVNENPLYAATHGMAIMGMAGEIAAEKADGPGTLQLHFYDALYNLNQNQIENLLKWKKTSNSMFTW